MMKMLSLNQDSTLFQPFQITPRMKIFSQSYTVSFCNFRQTADVHIVFQISNFHLFGNLISRSPDDELGVGFVVTAGEGHHCVHYFIRKAHLSEQLRRNVRVLDGVVQQRCYFGFRTFAPCRHPQRMPDIVIPCLVFLTLVSFPRQLLRLFKPIVTKIIHVGVCCVSKNTNAKILFFSE